MNRLSVLLLVTLFIGCAPPDEPQGPDQAALLDSLDVPEHVRQLDSLTVFDPSQVPDYSVRLEHDRTYGKMIYSQGIQRSLVDSMGQVYLSSSMKGRIHIYHPDGSLRDSLVREGRGPGEFVQIWKNFLHLGHPVYYDNLLSRIQVFAMDTFDPINTYNIERASLAALDSIDHGMMTHMHSLNNGELLIGTPLEREPDERVRYAFYRTDFEGNVLSDRLFVIKRKNFAHFAEGSKTLQSSPEGIVDVASDGTIFKVNTSEILIEKIDPRTGDRYHIFYPYDNMDLDKEEVLQGYDPWLRKRIRDADFGDQWPALKTMVVDDQKRIWLETITEAAETNQWWVLNPVGDLLGRFEFPPGQNVIAIQDGHLYVEKDDHENGLFWVDRYDINLEIYNPDER